MCEMLAASFAEARPFSELAAYAAGLEELGVAGFGWGVAWLDGDGTVRGTKGPGRFVDEGRHDTDLLARRSTRFLVHLRRPSRLSTLDMADTQPFFDGTDSAFCHNGLLARAEELRHRYSALLEGRADSEIGWRFFLDERAAGADTCTALRALDETFGGNMNLGVLTSSGELALYTRNATNRMWHFRLASAALASTDLHSDDDSLFERVFPVATDRRLLDPASTVVLAAAEAAAA